MRTVTLDPGDQQRLLTGAPAALRIPKRPHNFIRRRINVAIHNDCDVLGWRLRLGCKTPHQLDKGIASNTPADHIQWGSPGMSVDSRADCLLFGRCLSNGCPNQSGPGRRSFASFTYIWIPRPICLKFDMHFARFEAAFACAKAGSRRPAKMEIIAITTKSSISVNPWYKCFSGLFLIIIS